LGNDLDAKRREDLADFAQLARVVACYYKLFEHQKISPQRRKERKGEQKKYNAMERQHCMVNRPSRPHFSVF
jgi:hypothetical protein